MAAVVGWIQRLLRPVGRDRIASRNHTHDVAAFLRRLRAGLRAGRRTRRPPARTGALSVSPLHDGDRARLLFAGSLHRPIHPWTGSWRSPHHRGLRTGQARWNAARLLADAPNQPDRATAL